ncbi:MAG TPA: hypothetical protein PLW44_06450 [Chitinophagales bacterium]|nr:hypothetical protein [Chitinophagales bacterium]
MFLLDVGKAYAQLGNIKLNNTRDREPIESEKKAETPKAKQIKRLTT